MEDALSMPELTAILKAHRDKLHEDRKFSAAIQGIDLDAQSGDRSNAWEDLKARVASKGQATSSKDILSLQGTAAAQAGFGIGMGLDFEDLTKPATAEGGGEQ